MKQKIEAWLDNLINAMNEVNRFSYFCEDNMTFDSCEAKNKSIQIYNNIEELAEILGKELKKEYVECSACPDYYRIGFCYKDYSIFQIEDIERE